MFKFLHSADLHLDSPLRGLGRYDGAPVGQLRGATRQAFENLVDLAIAEEVAFVLFAGDLYDGDWRDYNTGLFFVHQMARLQEADIRAFLVFGNHDAQSRMTKSLRLPENVHAFRANRPDTRVLDDLGVAVHGQSFKHAAVTEDLSARYPAAEPSLLNIGLLHTCADGREGHRPYAPTTVDYLAGKGYEYWALGHVHRREELRREPWIVFPGNIQGRHIRETGPKGCTLVTVENGMVSGVEHRDLDVLRWQRCRVAASSADTVADLMDRVERAIAETAAGSEGRLTALRLDVSGPCRAHAELARAPEHWQNEIRARAATAGGDVWLEKVRLQTTVGLGLDEMLEREDALSGLLRSIQEMSGPDGDDGARVADLAELFTDLHAKLPAELREGEEALDLRDAAALRVAIDDAKELLLSRLMDTGGR